MLWYDLVSPQLTLLPESVSSSWGWNLLFRQIQTPLMHPLLCVGPNLLAEGCQELRKLLLKMG